MERSSKSIGQHVYEPCIYIFVLHKYIHFDLSMSHVEPWEKRQRTVNAPKSLLVSMTVGARRAGRPLLPVGASASLRVTEAVGSGAGRVHRRRTVRLSDRAPPRCPQRYNRTVMSEPSYAMTTSHDSAGRVGSFILCVCVCVCVCLCL